MNTISVINLKGGVGKSITSINIAYILSSVYGKRVLLIDNDKQGNTTKMFGLYSYDYDSIAKLLTEKIDIKRVIRKTEYPKLDVIPANMNLLQANKEVLLDTTRPQQTRLKKAFEAVKNEYDYCIIDNAPDINISVINALVASDDVIIPVKIDNFTFDGMNIMKEQIEEIKENFNEGIKYKCLITMYRRNDVNIQGTEYLEATEEMYKTKIRYTEKIDESTFELKPILEYSNRCGASKDYLKFVDEFLTNKL